MTTRKALFESYDIGMYWFLTSAESSETPTTDSRWKYTSGFLIKRDNNQANIILFGRDGTQIAMSSTTDDGKTWSNWVVK